MVMSAYSFPLIPTRDGVVAPRVAVVGTGGTLTISREDVHAQSVLNRDNELRWTKVKTKGWGWNHIQPISRVYNLTDDDAPGTGEDDDNSLFYS